MHKFYFSYIHIHDNSILGLFLSSGANLAKAGKKKNWHELFLQNLLTKFASIGPAGLLVAYAIIGFIVFWVAVELGEMAAYIPVRIMYFLHFLF